jgi:hypothetical protein
MKRVFLCMFFVTALFIANAQLAVVPGQQKAMPADVNTYVMAVQRYNNDSNLYAALSSYRVTENNELNCHAEVYAAGNNWAIGACEECDVVSLQDISPEPFIGINYFPNLFNSECNNSADVNDSDFFSEMPGITECVAFVTVVKKVGTVIKNKKKAAFAYQKPANRRSKVICPYNTQWTCPGKDKFLRDGSQLHLRLR